MDGCLEQCVEKNSEVDSRVIENVFYDRLARLAIDTLLMHIYMCAHLGHACFVEEGRHLLVILMSSGDHYLRNNNSSCPLSPHACLYTCSYMYSNTQKYANVHTQNPHKTSDQMFLLLPCVSVIYLLWVGEDIEKRRQFGSSGNL